MVDLEFRNSKLVGALFKVCYTKYTFELQNIIFIVMPMLKQVQHDNCHPELVSGSRRQ